MWPSPGPAQMGRPGIVLHPRMAAHCATLSAHGSSRVAVASLAVAPPAECRGLAHAPWGYPIAARARSTSRVSSRVSSELDGRANADSMLSVTSAWP